MSYRNITVDNKVYEYVIGKTTVKIKGVGLFKKEKVANRVGIRGKLIVTPATIKALVKGEKVPVVLRCRYHNVVTNRYMIDPFEKTIYNKIFYKIKCSKCYDNLAQRI